MARGGQSIFEMAAPMVGRELSTLRRFMMGENNAGTRIYTSDPLESLAHFQGYMARKLVENYHKPGWSQDTVASLRKRVAQELMELDKAIDDGQPYEVIAREAADVANMVMMIQDRFWK